ncbi:MAG: peptide-methionine (R)-S-oxide reductase MsrB [Candidatus Marinimicrobia bacterium]|jgi:methionine-R-sulfoxide reductase|nr:peptide-methionine (R)-S-oxide reductase MsrB [Candidatus Neomarinimicrobiota bacterium]MBT3633553.1 peptide-methionine (R)-S-oxide reductase MsrB [Candidatus Neomarinimicrobiota bacterium]MBT3682494.1 peptide-methionine (R)-S-oxide reductase MsrB [Candidatus Neomarinimicrobiota bacterium]MBT3759258.1 peptide-methionine (R)-S-oxide reductase MsrB [Candidatus Neomarinimicrobiota bacterium]MBT3895469.1 peptide-methionine (R)-S-oxide reductase MsrB [Candidatus Neomarinimicrobiota bacterium]
MKYNGNQKSIIVLIFLLTTFCLFANQKYNKESIDSSGYRKDTIREESQHIHRNSTSGKNYSFNSIDKKSRVIELTKLQYEVTQNNATERPFNNEYWDNNRQGIYVDIVSGEPLFCSLDKFKSGTGWPSFKRPISDGNIIDVEDRKFFISRTEVRSSLGDSHLGHVFKDGPAPTGLRYCINSAALRFIPQSDLQFEGYGEFIQLFE